MLAGALYEKLNEIAVNTWAAHVNESRVHDLPELVKRIEWVCSRQRASQRDESVVDVAHPAERAMSGFKIEGWQPAKLGICQCADDDDLVALHARSRLRTPTSMPVMVEPNTQGRVMLVITSHRGSELHRSQHPTEEEARLRLGQLAGVLVPKPSTVVFAQQMRVGDGDLDAVIDEHEAMHGVITCGEILAGLPQLPMVRRLLVALNAELKYPWY